MIRFEPDTWREALLRPLAMVAPDSHIYLEIRAPDLRFVFVALLSIVALLMARRLQAPPRATRVLWVLLILSFVPWLATSGNGRYFIPFLVVVGPLCLALANWLPWRKSAKLLAALLMLGLQSYVIFDSPPWRSWTLVPWRDAPYFKVALADDMKSEPATYVTITSISYSLIAPLFDARSHWINVSSMTEDPSISVETRKAHVLFAASRRLFVVLPTVPSHMGEHQLPSSALLDIIDRRLAPQELALERSQPCRLVQSKSMATFAGGRETYAGKSLERFGFWVCRLRYPVPAPAPAQRDQAIDAVFERIERECPRYFPPGESATRPAPGGAVRDYPSADMKLYVLDNGGVYYKYWRALNPELIARVPDVMKPSFHFGCEYIRGRSGLPWEREI